MVDQEKELDTSGISFEAPENYIHYNDHRPMYSFDDCKDPSTGRPCPIHGWMLGTVKLNPAKENVKANVPIDEQMFDALVVRLIDPCIMRMPDKTLGIAKPGTECIVSGADLDDLFKPAQHPTLMFSVWLKPESKQLKLGGGRKMKLFEKHIGKTARKRDDADRVLREFLTTERTPNALPAGPRSSVPFDEERETGVDGQPL